MAWVVPRVRPEKVNFSLINHSLRPKPTKTQAAQRTQANIKGGQSAPKATRRDPGAPLGADPRNQSATQSRSVIILHQFFEHEAFAPPVGHVTNTNLHTTITSRDLVDPNQAANGLRRQLATFAEDFAHRILFFDEGAAGMFAVIAAARRTLGRPISNFDTHWPTRTHAATLATRNTGFRPCGINPGKLTHES